MIAKVAQKNLGSRTNSRGGPLCTGIIFGDALPVAFIKGGGDRQIPTKGWRSEGPTLNYFEIEKIWYNNGLWGWLMGSKWL